MYHVEIDFDWDATGRRRITIQHPTRELDRAFTLLNSLLAVPFPPQPELTQRAKADRIRKEQATHDLRTE